MKTDNNAHLLTDVFGIRRLELDNPQQILGGFKPYLQALSEFGLYDLKTQTIPEQFDKKLKVTPASVARTLALMDLADDVTGVLFQRPGVWSNFSIDPYRVDGGLVRLNDGEHFECHNFEALKAKKPDILPPANLQKNERKAWTHPLTKVSVIAKTPLLVAVKHTSELEHNGDDKYRNHCGLFYGIAVSGNEKKHESSYSKLTYAEQSTFFSQGNFLLTLATNIAKQVGPFEKRMCLKNRSMLPLRELIIAGAVRNMERWSPKTGLHFVND